MSSPELPRAGAAGAGAGGLSSSSCCSSGLPFISLRTLRYLLIGVFIRLCREVGGGEGGEGAAQGAGGWGDRTHTTGHVCGGQRGRVRVRGCVCVVRVLPNYLFMKKSHVWLCVGEGEKRGKGGKKKGRKAL